MLQLIAVVRCKWCKYIMFCSSNTDDNKSYLCHSRWQFDEDPEVLIIPWSHCIRLNLPGLPLNLVSNKIRSTFGQRCPLSPPSPCNFPLTIYIYKYQAKSKNEQRKSHPDLLAFAVAGDVAQTTRAQATTWTVKHLSIQDVQPFCRTNGTKRCWLLELNEVI